MKKNIEEIKTRFRYQCWGCTNDTGIYDDHNERVVTCPTCKMSQKTKPENYIVL